MPFVEITTGSDLWVGEEEKKKLSKAVYDSIIEVYQEVKGYKPQCWVVIREHPTDNLLINGESLTEIRKKQQAQR